MKALVKLALIRTTKDVGSINLHHSDVDNFDEELTKVAGVFSNHLCALLYPKQDAVKRATD